MCCRGGGILKESDIRGDEVAINVGRITSIALLKARITQEDTLVALAESFSCIGMRI